MPAVSELSDALKVKKDANQMFSMPNNRQRRTLGNSASGQIPAYQEYLVSSRSPFSVSVKVNLLMNFLLL